VEFSSPRNGPREDPRWSVPLDELLLHRATATPDAVAVHDDLERTITFSDLDGYATRIAAELAAHGLDARSRVAWSLPTWIETLVVICALSRLGTTQVALPYAYRENEIRTALCDTDADVLITPAQWRGFDYAAMATRLAAELPDLAHAPIRRGQIDDPTWFPGLGHAREHDERRRFAPDVRWVFFTSGTSGSPKGVLHTDRSVTIPATTMADGFELSPEDRSAVAFPLGHVGGVEWLVAGLQTGCRLLLAERLDEAAIDTFDAQQVTLAGVSTAFHLAYRDRARAAPDRPLFGKVRAYPGGAATKPPSLHEELRREIGGVGIVAGYGLTECSMITMSTVRDPTDKLATSEGRLSPGVSVELRDPATGSLSAVEDAGEIWVNAPHLFRGYVSPEGTDAGVDDRGYFRTGDIGYVDDDGFVHITGRLKDVIIRKGENISATEVEDHIFTHPGVADVAVIGIPDERAGECCCAVVVASPGCPVPTVSEIGEHLRERGLMTQKWPERVYDRPALPRNDAGKVLKYQLVRDVTRETA
jgi:acyl-CoA synthetase (AMP-forming)/AMP-acid ligase II